MTNLNSARPGASDWRSPGAVPADYWLDREPCPSIAREL